MFKKGQSYIYRGVTIKYNRKTCGYFAYVDADDVKSRFDAITVAEMISILDRVF